MSKDKDEQGVGSDIEDNQLADTALPIQEPPGLDGIKAWTQKWLAILIDFRFTDSLVLHALPAVYVVMLLGGGIATLYLIGDAFSDSWLRGLVWLFVGPVVFLVGLSLVRAVLEFFAAMLQMAMQLDSMQTDMARLTAIPRWFSKVRANDSEGEQA